MVQVGCGGQFDATNVVSTAVSVICSVCEYSVSSSFHSVTDMYYVLALDHTRILGSTLEAIARNKAGIMRADRPALVGPDVQWEVMQVGIRLGGLKLLGGTVVVTVHAYVTMFCNFIQYLSFLYLIRK